MAKYECRIFLEPTRGARGASNPFGTCTSRAIQKGGARGIIILDLNQIFFLPFPRLSPGKLRAVQIFYRHDKFQYSNAYCRVTRSRVCFRKISAGVPYRIGSRVLDRSIIVCVFAGPSPFDHLVAVRLSRTISGGYLSPILNANGEYVIRDRGSKVLKLLSLHRAHKYIRIAQSSVVSRFIVFALSIFS